MQDAKPKKARRVEDSSVSESESGSEELSDSQDRRIAEERIRMNKLQSSKEKFIADINKKDPGSKNLTPRERMKQLIENSERLANFLLTKHSMQKQIAKKSADPIPKLT